MKYHKLYAPLTDETMFWIRESNSGRCFMLYTSTYNFQHMVGKYIKRNVYRFLLLKYKHEVLTKDDYFLELL